ncbi:MAG: polysaccharide deacetylase family protein [Bacteroidia bacterium]|nr:polysaccharide deacetylase family protein [Bacteroidia bacterium]
MRIMHVLSQTQVTGAEVYAATIADAQIANGHHVIIVSDTFQTPSQAAVLFQPISKRNYSQRIKNIRFLKQLIQKEQIQVVHAHSRAASWVCNWATRNTNAVYLSTIHGRQHLHLSVKLWNIYGKKLLPVSDAIAQHLIHEVGIDPAKIQVIPNPVEAQPHDFQEPENLSLLIAGRMSGPKGEIIAKLLAESVPTLLQNFPDLTVTIAGGDIENIGTAATQAKKEITKTYPRQVFFPGFVKELNPAIEKHSLIMASGRIAIESLLVGKPVFAIGEAASIGLVTSKNLSQSLVTNFGDILSDKKATSIDFQAITQELSTFFKNPIAQNPKEVTESIRNYFNPKHIYRTIETQYQETIGRKIAPTWIPILMLHKIPKEPIQTKHRIFLTQNKFEKLVKYLKNSGFSTITFQEYQHFRAGVRPLSEFPKKPIILTFDDAYLDNYTNAFPILLEHQFKATIFSLGDLQATTNFWDTQTGEPEAKLMTVQHRREMSQYGIEFGAHSMKHQKLSTLSAQELNNDLLQSKKNIEDCLGLPVLSFAYPYGDVTETVKRATQEAGYLFGISTDSGGITIEDDRYEIFRVNIFPEESIFSIWKKTQPFYRTYYRWKRKK